MEDRFKPIKGGRVIVRMLKPSDAAELAEKGNDYTIARYIPNIPHPYSLKDAKNYISFARKQAEKKDYHLAITEAATGELAGTVGLHVKKEPYRAETGYWLAKGFRGKGFASEALDLVLEFGFTKLKLEKVTAKVFTPNKESQKLLERKGFKREGRLRRHYKSRDGRWWDEYRYGLLKSEWKQ